MSLINWNDSFSVGIAEIDEQHINLVKMLNELTDAMKAGKGNDVMSPIIQRLIKYTQTHFKTEESLFKSYNYPDASEHISEHRDFVEKISVFNEDFKSGKKTLSIDILNFLAGWLQSHIKGTDKKYSEFLISHGA